MKKLSLLELQRLSISEYRAAIKVPLVVVLDNVRSAMNVGSIFRTCDAMAVEKIHLCGITATPPNKEITKTAIGATDAVAWTYFSKTEDALRALRSDGYHIISIEQTDASIDLAHVRIPEGKVAIVLGNEVQGVSDTALGLSDQAVELAQYGTKHSLNVSVCAGIVIYSLAERLRANDR